MSKRSARHKKEFTIIGNKDLNPEKIIEPIFREAFTDVIKADNDTPEDILKMQKKHWTGIFRQRRTEAMLRLLPVIKEKCYPSSDIVSESDLTLAFLTNEVYPEYDYNGYDFLGTIRLGAIIWILDNLKRVGNLEKVVKRLPYFGTSSGSPLLPKNFYHPCYSNAVLESMMVVTTMRFEPPEVKVLTNELFNENLVLKANVEGRPYNVVFKDIIEMLPQEMIKKVCNDFRDMVLRTVQIFMKGHCFLQEKYVTGKQFLIKVDEEARRVISEKRKFVGPVSSLHTSIPLSRLGLQSPPSWPTNLAYNGEENSYLSLDNLEHISTNLIEYTPRFSSFFIQDSEQLHDYFDDKDIEDSFLNYSVNDPFAMCFALMYLFDHDDDYPWLFRSGGCVANETLLSLPWGSGKIVDGESDKLLERVWFKSADFAPEGWLDKPFDSVDCYSRKNRDINLAQMFYRQTGCVFPSGTPDPFKANKELSGWGRSSFEDGFVSGAAYSFYLSSKQTRLPDEIDSKVDESDEENADSIEEADDAAERKQAAIADFNSKLSEANKSKEDLRKELLQVKRELKSLKRAVAEDRKRYASESLQKEEELHKARQEHMELIDLRERFFHINSEEDLLDSLQDVGDIKWPYETKKRVIVFGGHPNFIKQMKSLLPGVRFVDVDNLAFNPDIVRNADVIWIQNNYLSHAQFYNVTKEARQYNVQIRYFAYSSSEKSAMQIVEDDIASND